jgi:hypothetical protein
MPIALLVVPVAAAFDPLLARFHVSGTARWHVLALVLVAGLAVADLPYLARFSSSAMELEVRNTLESLPPDSVIFGSIDELDVGTRYLQLARGIRPDVLFVRTDDLFRPWYRARFGNAGLRLEGRLGVPLKIDLADQVLAQGRPLFVSQGEATELVRFTKVPYGVVTRILPAWTPRPSIAEVVELNRQLFERFHLDYPFPGPDDEYATWVHRNYARLWTILGQALLASGNRDAAGEAEAIAARLSPR